MTSTQNIRELEQLYRQLPQLGADESSAFLTRLARNPEFIMTQILPALSRAQSGSEPAIAATYGVRESSPCLQVFVWPAGAATPVHDHTSWGAYYCVVGTLLEERYERLDDGSREGHARLRKAWQLTWGPEDGVSTVLPGDMGIHRVSNPGEGGAISVHLYGPRTGEVDGRDYDPSHDHVCDRRD